MTLQNAVLESLHAVNKKKHFNISVIVKGSGLHAQADAIRLGISRALIIIDPELRKELKPLGFLSRDSRMKERKKAGQPGARKNFQFSKR